MTNITLSVTRPSMRVFPSSGHGSRSDKALAEVRESVLGQARFARRCHFCDLQFGAVADECELHHLDGDHGNLSSDNLVPACVFCHMPHHLDLAAKRWPDSPGTLIYLPEKSQADLSSLLQAIVFAIAVQPPDMRPGDVSPLSDSTGQAIYPFVIYNRLFARAADVERAASGGQKIREGFSQPHVVARVLRDMSAELYDQREQLLAGVRYLLPLEPMVELAKQWPMDGGAFSRLDLASWSAILRPEEGAGHGR